VLGGQLGTGIAWEIIKLWLAGIEVVGLVVTALATKPANMTENIDAWTRSFIIWLPLGVIFRLAVEAWFQQVYSALPFQLHVFSHIRGYLLLTLP
jgi:hypothetical protein